ncbi:MAG TPA: ankyrin repeat domain-containing protein [Nodularia sp. (in: cyanobacteria)]|nr:ankyrin repeat domain-containing protein [Nodularia sp. (in: cyanobacteria)]
MRKRTFSRALRSIQAAIVSSILGLFLFLAFRFSSPIVFYFLIGFFGLFTSSPGVEWCDKGYLIGIQFGRFSGIIAGALLTFYTFRKLILLPVAWLPLATVIAVTSACLTWLNTLGPYMLETAIQKRNLKEVELLLKLGVNVEKGYNHRNLETAVRSGSENIVLLLIAKGAKADQDSLSEAIYKGRKDFVELFLAKGANVNGIDQVGRFPLMMAIENEKTEIVELLLAKGANVNNVTSYGWTPLQSAIGSRDKSIVLLLIAKGAKADQGSFSAAITSGRKDVVELLLAKGAKADQDSLSAAIKLQNKEIVELLLAKGANVNGVDQGGDTPLLHAVDSTFSSETREIVDLLLAKGANVNSINRDGETPLRKAIGLNRVDLVQLLFAKGADAKGLLPDERRRLDEHLRAIFVDRR